MSRRLLLIGFVLLLSGCSVSSAVSHGHNTALDGVDLVTMTDLMARSIAADPKVAEAYTSGWRLGIVAPGAETGWNRPLSIVVQPVENHLTGEILPAGQAEAFTARVRFLLSRHEPAKFIWVMNRDSYYRLRQRELDVDLGPEPGRVQPDYALVARFYSLTDESSRQRSAAYLCVYQLYSLRNGAVIWTDRYEVKKTAVKGMFD